MAHVLVVGGVGYLEQVIHFLARHGNTVSVIARSEERLNTLLAEAGDFAERINPIAIDFPHAHTLNTHVLEAIRKHGPVVLGINWSHSGTTELGLAIAGLIQNSSPVCRFFQLWGTESMDNEQDLAENNPYRHLNRILFRAILLSYPQEEGELSHYFTTEEISEGVIDAIRNDRKTTKIAAIGDWEGQPQSA